MSPGSCGVLCNRSYKTCTIYKNGCSVTFKAIFNLQHIPANSQALCMSHMPTDKKKINHTHTGQNFSHA